MLTSFLDWMCKFWSNLEGLGYCTVVLVVLKIYKKRLGQEQTENKNSCLGSKRFEIKDMVQNDREMIFEQVLN